MANFSVYHYFRLLVTEVREHLLDMVGHLFDILRPQIIVVVTTTLQHSMEGNVDKTQNYSKRATEAELITF